MQGAFDSIVGGIKQGIGNAIDIYGTSKGYIPEMGISEKVAGGSTVNTGNVKPIDVALKLGSKVLGATTTAPTTTAPQSYQKQSTPTPTNDGGGGGGGGGGLNADILKSKFGFNDQNVINSILNSPSETARYLQQLGLSSPDEERARIDEQQAKVREAISSSYQPIYESLDSRIGLLGPQKDQFLSSIGELVTSQQGVVETNKNQGVRNLDASASKEETLAKSSIRDLEGDVRNQLKAYSNYFGGIGAGDSSAAQMEAPSAIGTQALKSRSAIQGGLQSAISAIELKKQDVSDLASNQLASIEQWKSNQIQETQTFFAQRLDDLETAKANAKGAEATAIANMIQNTEQQYVSRLQELDDKVFSFNQSIQTWQAQRQADLEDYATKLSLSSQYSSTGASTNKAALDAFNKATNSGLTLGQAKSLVEGQYGSDSLAGLELTGDQANQSKTDPFQTLQQNIVGALSTGSGERTGINLGPLTIGYNPGN